MAALPPTFGRNGERARGETRRKHAEEVARKFERPVDAVEFEFEMADELSRIIEGPTIP
jgi:hypothetical protein